MKYSVATALIATAQAVQLGFYNETDPETIGT